MRDLTVRLFKRLDSNRGPGDPDWINVNVAQ
jgi:hypothetical protein